MFYKFIYSLARALFSLVYRIDFYGRENIKNEAYVLCGNHSNEYDPVFIAFAFGVNGKISFMAKKELFKNPLLAFFFGHLNAFPVDRKSADISAIKNSLKMLKNGYSLILFPEGTRVKEGETLKAKAGVGMIAVKAGVKVLPIYIGGSKKFFSRVSVTIGEPIDVAENLDPGKKAAMDDYERISESVMDKVYKLADARRDK